MAVVETAIANGAAGQLYVSQGDRRLADFAWGTAPGGAAMRTDSLVSWASAVKPATCVCLIRLWEAGELDLDDPVTRFIPEFGVGGKEGVLVRHLLTHTAHLGGYSGPTQLEGGYSGVVRGIIEAPRLAGAAGVAPRPGTEPGYNPAGIWIVAEICVRIHGRPFDEIIRREVFEPCGMSDSWCGMPVERLREYRAAGRIASNYLSDEETAPIPQPAGGGLGPARELGRFYEMMLGRGAIDGRRILSPQTVEAMTTPKTGPGSQGVWGLGFNVPIPDGLAPAPARPNLAALHERRFGPHASMRSFGHPGASGMIAFADPEHGLAVTHIGAGAVNASIYEDLGLA
jgi:CubicO group peptidase (beta-lactamase class C family)